MPPQEPSLVKGLFFSAASSFTSFVTHAGAAPFQMYVAPLRLPPPLYAGTAVFFFAAANYLKVAPYFFLGQFSSANLLTAAVLMPIAVPATVFGVWLILAVGFFLIWQGTAGLIG